MPAIIPLIIEAAQEIIKYSPDIVKAVKLVKDLIAALFTAKVITKEEQDRLNSDVDIFLAGFEAGRVRPGWEVRPDPETTTTVGSIIKVGEVKRYSDPQIIGLCEIPPSKKCWDVPVIDMRQLANSYIWTVGGMYFQMPADFKP
jgi:hypothetical protein